MGRPVDVDRQHAPRPVFFRRTRAGDLYTCDGCPRLVRPWGSRFRHLTWGRDEWQRWESNRLQHLEMERY